MAHFAELDNNNKVLRVIVVSSDDIKDKNGQENEEIGKLFLQNIYGEDTKWVQTSYSARIRKKYAGIGDTYDESLDEFIVTEASQE